MAITKEQEERRRRYIGSSDVPRIMAGQSVRLVLEKLNYLEPEEPVLDAEDEEDENALVLEQPEDAIEIEIGHKVESIILDAYEAQFKPLALRRSPDSLINPEYPWLIVHLDGEADYPEQTVNTEVKSVGWYQRKHWGYGGSQVPIKVVWQTQTQMLVRGLKLTHVPVCFINETSLRLLFVERQPPISLFSVPADTELQTYIIQRTMAVWQYIETRTIPPPETLSDVLLLYKRGEDSVVEATDEIAAIHQLLMDEREKKKVCERAIKRYKFELQSFMNTASELFYRGKRIATWKNDADSQKFDSKRFARENPEIYNNYLVPKPGSRKFLPKGSKDGI